MDCFYQVHAWQHVKILYWRLKLAARLVISEAKCRDVIMSYMTIQYSMLAPKKEVFRGFY